MGRRLGGAVVLRCQGWDVDGLRELLAVGVALVSDSDGKAPQGDKGISAAGNVARILAAIVTPFAQIGVVTPPTQLAISALR